MQKAEEHLKRLPIEKLIFYWTTQTRNCTADCQVTRAVFMAVVTTILLPARVMSTTAFLDRLENWETTNFVSNIVLVIEENSFIVLNASFNLVSAFLVISFTWLYQDWLVSILIATPQKTISIYLNSIHYFIFL